MASDRQNLQDAFLNHVRKTKVPVTIFLINGVKLNASLAGKIIELAIADRASNLDIRVGLEQKTRLGR